MKTTFKTALKHAALGGAIAALSAGAFAANDGALGFTSQGDVDINLVINDEVRISGMTDINLNFSGTDVTGNTSVCIYRNTAATYEITATGSGTAGAFELSNGTDTVDYTVAYDDFTSATPVVPLTTGNTVTRDGADQTDDTCTGLLSTGPTGDISVTVNASDAAALPAATYSGTLFLMVAPG